MAQVKRHTRVVNGRRVVVKTHRRQLRPRRAWHNAKKANRQLNKRAYTAAFVLASVAAAEIGAWALFRVTGVVLLGAAMLLAGLAQLARKYAS